ncbi:DUF4880 domain-containing protein [Pseudomonas sp. KNUC1026]|uniref:DUF4880 domain-containing protein n=1 Tax=Pseudomonas sp. KNUC1026 TaxID=2893890 RepID=UPI001F413A43|nr:DUF4880 domain-containing protein [Pseudomonas sp. KNUC1026]UFH49456.1 DUF4880 domain-containing protein [Pseudomonas sp. KNUC1026]
MTPEPDIVRQAAQWWVRLREHHDDPRLWQACERWRRAAPDHQLAWERVSQLSADLNQGLRQTPGARQALETSEHRLSRRRTLKLLIGGVAVGGAGWLAAEQTPWRRWASDFATSTGQQGRFTLPGGALLTLNTHSSADSLHEGNLRLNEGELLLESMRPMQVQCRGTSISLNSARVVVRQSASYSQLAVLHGEAWLGGFRVGAGQVARAGGGQADLITPAFDPAAWLEGLIVTQGMPLGAFLDEVGRYRKGLIRYTPEVAELRVSGVYKLADTDRLLQLLPQSLPVRVGGLTRWWVSVEAAG